MIDYFSPFLRPHSILTSQDDRDFYGRDRCQAFKPSPELVLLPEKAEEVQKIMRICNEHRIPVVPSGGRTGYSGGAAAVNSEIIVSLERMNKVISVNKLERTLTCEAGTVTKKIQHEAQKHGLFYPVDFASSGSSQIGGNIATNAGGVKVIRYGNTRDWVLGMKVVLPTGELIELNGPLVKNRSGYDLRELFVGSEGTLGIIVEAVLKLTLPPVNRTAAVCGVQNFRKVLTLFEMIRESGQTLSAFECFTANGLALVLAEGIGRDPLCKKTELYVLFEIEHENENITVWLEEIYKVLLGQNVIQDMTFSQNSKQFKELWALRENISETISKRSLTHKNDISVPVSRIADFSETLCAYLKKDYPGLEVVIFGHVGDGNLHINVLKPKEMETGEFLMMCEKIDASVYSLVSSMGGSISAEHGIGLLKKKWLGTCRTTIEIKLMKEIKRIFDPYNILNPGKIF